MFLLLSAPGTGTNFVLQFLTFTGWKQSRLRINTEQEADFVLTHSHLPTLREFEEKIGPIGEHFSKVVIPLRHPYRSYRSRTGRGESGQELIEYWRGLTEFADKFPQVYYVPLEVAVDKRVELMQGLADFVGLKKGPWVTDYATNWTPVNKTRDMSLKLKNYIPGFSFAVEWYRTSLQESI